MPDATLDLVIGGPPIVWSVLGEEAAKVIMNAHPNVRVQSTTDKDEFAALALQADALMTFGYQVPAESLKPGSRLRWVHCIPAGIDAIATPELLEAEHVAFTSSKGPHAPMIAEQIILLMLSLARHMPAMVQDQAAHEWSRKDTAGAARTSIQLLGKTVAVLGVGQIGGHVARICKVGFGMKVLGMSRTSRDCPYVDEYLDLAALRECLGRADFIVLSIALTPATEKMLGKEQFDAMKPTAILINGGRGGLIDEDALIQAMNAGTIAGVGLDAVTVEPLSGDSPLWDLPNTIITPHSGALTDNLGEEVANFFADNIRRFAEGKPLLGTVHRQEGY